MDTTAIARTLTDRLESLDAELTELTAVPRDPVTAVSFGKRIGDGTTEAIDRMTKIGTADQLAVMRTDVVRALAKIDEGTYGLCDRCSGMIPDERLEARPWAVLCVSCAARRASCPDVAPAVVRPCVPHRPNALGHWHHAAGTRRPDRRAGCARARPRARPRMRHGNEPGLPRRARLARERCGGGSPRVRGRRAPARRERRRDGAARGCDAPRRAWRRRTVRPRARHRVFPLDRARAA